MCVCMSTCVFIPRIVHMYVMQYPLLSFSSRDMDVFIVPTILCLRVVIAPPLLSPFLPLSLSLSLFLTLTHLQTAPVEKNSDQSHRLPDFSGKLPTWAVLTLAELVLQEMAAKGEELVTDQQKRASINSINKCPLCVP